MKAGCLEQLAFIRYGIEGYGVSLLMRVSQLPRVARVPPQLPNGLASYWARVHVCPMYSEAIQIELPTATAAP